MEIGSVPEKMDEIFSLGTYIICMYSARNWVLVMYKGIYYIRNSLWGALGSSNPGCLKFLKRFNKKNRFPEMINFFLYCIKKMSF